MDPTPVDDAEDLYRAISAGHHGYTIRNGVYIISQSAFDDSEQKPSVDRSSIRTAMVDTKMSPTDGVIVVNTGDVRKSCKVPILDPKGKPIGGEYNVDVKHRPIVAPDPENLAHCQIESSPMYTNSSRFKKVKEALARLANKKGFIILPT
jgi:hypothetical protein